MTRSAQTTADPDTAALTQRLLDEGLIGAAAAARLLGTLRDGRPTHPSTVARWVTRGVRLPDGRPLRLEAVRLGGRLVTSKPALVRFVAAQQLDATAPPPRPTAPSARRRASDAAAAELRRLGC